MKNDTPSWKVSDIAGSEVFNLAGDRLGFLTDVLPTGANDVWVVGMPDSGRQDILVPALKTVVIEVDIVNKKIIVDLPKGLKEIYED